MTSAIDGFWLPRNIYQQIISEDTEYEQLCFNQGRPATSSNGATCASWPRLDFQAWLKLIKLLQANRQRAPRGPEFWERLQAALEVVSQRFSNPEEPLRALALQALPNYTGYSPSMIRFTLGSLDLMSLDGMPAAFRFQPDHQAARRWVRMPGLTGRLRFYPDHPLHRLAATLPGAKRSLFQSARIPDFAVGYGAGNVPGTALMIAFLAQATTLEGGSPPAVVIKNSRREPIFSPLILRALEEADADLVSGIAVLIWDYADTQLQNALLSQADLVVAAASDETITQVQTQIGAAPRGDLPPARFHAHGHKVSFSAISADALRRDAQDPQTGADSLDIITLLAGLDSVFWDQHGCLSSRIHFIETGVETYYTPAEYSQRLVEQLRRLAVHLPRGAWPRQQIYDRFDRYTQLEMTGQVKVFSDYEDEFLVALDERELTPMAFFSQINECQGRIIIIRPVRELMEIPERYFHMLPAQNLQSLSVALGTPGEEISAEFLKFSTACGARGLTAIRTVGRGAFPQLSYSWDGLIPLDLIARRPAGHFTSIEFDQPFDQILDTYHLMLKRGADLA